MRLSGTVPVTRFECPRTGNRVKVVDYFTVFTARHAQIGCTVRVVTRVALKVLRRAKLIVLKVALSAYCSNWQTICRLTLRLISGWV
jgi:hypothetical protein